MRINRIPFLKAGIREIQVAEKISMSQQWIEDRMKEGTFPLPVWRECDIDGWIADLPVDGPGKPSASIKPARLSENEARSWPVEVSIKHDLSNAQALKRLCELKILDRGRLHRTRWYYLNVAGISASNSLVPEFQ